MTFSESENARNNKGGPRHTPRPEGPTREDPSAGWVHTVFSAEGHLYQRWQADLLAYSHEKVRQPGPLTRLLASDGQAPLFRVERSK